LRKNASEHAMGAADAPGATGWIGAERHPTLPEEEENDERAETRVASEGAGALVESVKRSG
jgi:hypothetical protein